MTQSKNLCCLILLLLASLAPATPSHAQKLYKTTWTESGTILGSSALLLGVGTIIENRRGPHTIDDLAALDSETIFAFDNGTIGYFSSQAKINSDHLKNGIFIAPLSLFLSGQARENMREIMIMYAEVFSLNGGITRFTKGAIGRYRPYAYNPDVPINIKLSPYYKKVFLLWSCKSCRKFIFFHSYNI